MCYSDEYETISERLDNDRRFAKAYYAIVDNAVEMIRKTIKEYDQYEYDEVCARVASKLKVPVEVVEAIYDNEDI